MVRWGGDEFIVASIGIKDEKILYEFGEKIRRAVAENVFTKQNINLTISIGGVLKHSNVDTSLNDLVDSVDRALYDSKYYKNCVTIHALEIKNSSS